MVRVSAIACAIIFAALMGYAVHGHMSEGSPSGLNAEIAATVNGHAIRMSDVQRDAMQMAGTSALQQLIEYRVIDDEARKKGITVTPADLDQELQKQRQKLAMQSAGPPQEGRPGAGSAEQAPRTLEDMLKKANIPMSQFDEIMRHKIEVRKLLIGQVEKFPLYHVRAIMVFTSTPGAMLSGPKHSDAQAKALIQKADGALKSGKSWEDVAKQYSEEAGSKSRSGDLGIINKVSGYDSAFVAAAAKMKNGTRSTPLKLLTGYAIEERLSASDDHPASEDSEYQNAESRYEDAMINRIASNYVADLVHKANVVNRMTR